LLWFSYKFAWYNLAVNGGEKLAFTVPFTFIYIKLRTVFTLGMSGPSPNSSAHVFESGSRNMHRPSYGTLPALASVGSLTVQLQSKWPFYTISLLP